MVFFDTEHVILNNDSQFTKKSFSMKFEYPVIVCCGHDRFLIWFVLVLQPYPNPVYGFIIFNELPCDGLIKLSWGNTASANRDDRNKQNDCLKFSHFSFA